MPQGLGHQLAEGGHRLAQLRRIQRDHLAVAAAGLLLEFVGGALGDHRALVDDDDVVAEDVGLFQILRGQQNRDALLLERVDQIPHTLAAARVQAGGRLVEEDHLRAHHQPAGDVDATAHTAGVVPHRALTGADQVEFLEQGVGAAAGVLLGQTHQPAEQFEVLASGEVLVQRRVLPRHHDRAPHPGRIGDHVVPGHRGAARIGPQQGGQDLDRGGLAGAVGSEDAQHRGAGRGETDALQRLHLAEGFAHIIDHDGRIGAGGAHTGTAGRIGAGVRRCRVGTCPRRCRVGTCPRRCRVGGARILTRCVRFCVVQTRHQLSTIGRAATGLSGTLIFVPVDGYLPPGAMLLRPTVLPSLPRGRAPAGASKYCVAVVFLP
ncbi:Uncharacterised protein [Nocardia africana]|uniref:Uncharacterized protein n=1 Tax=Nocardia africana TaxID=134964 RepID=A0A378WMV4_9NOCA|nr:Uncharacterised protein [Nocardia africana]